MIEPSASEVASRLWNRYLNKSKMSDLNSASLNGYKEYLIVLEEQGIIHVGSDFQYRCMRCEGIADKSVRTRHGIDRLCACCAHIVLSDRQCLEISQGNLDIETTNG